MLKIHQLTIKEVKDRATSTETRKFHFSELTGTGDGMHICIMANVCVIPLCFSCIIMFLETGLFCFVSRAMGTLSPFSAVNASIPAISFPKNTVEKFHSKSVVVIQPTDRS